MEKYKRLTDRDIDYKNSEPVDLLYVRLAELENKIENGTLKYIPCRVGDEMYVIKNNKIEWYRIHKVLVARNRITIKGYVIKKHDIWYKTIRSLATLNKTWFLTYEEANRRLKELKGEK